MSNSADPIPSETPLFAPTRPNERISSLDVLRGVAVLGILLLNIVAFGLPIASYADPTIAGGAEGINLSAWVVNEVFFEGTQRTIFSLLFGAGILRI